MAYKLKLDDFDYFIPDANNVIQDQVLMLGYNLLPGVKNWSGFPTQFFSPDDEVTLYLDEREDKEHLFIGGCLVPDFNAHLLDDELNTFKKTFRPELNASDWFLKGSGSWVTNVGIQKETMEEALSRWILWAKFLKTLSSFYRFHSVSIDKEKIIYKETKPKKINVERYQRAYEALFKTLEQNRFSKIRVVTDNVEEAQLTGLQEAIKNSSSILEKEIELYPPVSKKDFSSNFSHWLQFVDMQIYALSRFIFPSGCNVLMDFEKYSYELSNGNFTISNDSGELMKQRLMVSKYFILRDIFHHLRHRFVTKLVSPNYEKTLSSMVCISDKETLNFADLVDSSIHNFCNRPNSEITFDFNAV
jgi:hypothetical protein